jgi:hypothetical protein
MTSSKCIDRQGRPVHMSKPERGCLDDGRFLNYSPFQAGFHRAFYFRNLPSRWLQVGIRLLPQNPRSSKSLPQPHPRVLNTTSVAMPLSCHPTIPVTQTTDDDDPPARTASDLPPSGTPKADTPAWPKPSRIRPVTSRHSHLDSHQSHLEAPRPVPHVIHTPTQSSTERFH